jgi:hypothetical protein
LWFQAVEEVGMLAHLVSRFLLLSSVLVVLTCTVLASVYFLDTAAAVVMPPQTWTVANAGAATTPSPEVTTSTSRPRQQRTRGSGTVLPLVLAAIIFLALVPVSGVHSHEHRHLR